MTSIKASIGSTHYKTEVVSGDNRIIADEPVSVGGQGLGFSPRELLAASLASCTTITLRMYADRKQWPAGEIEVEVQFEKTADNSISQLVRKIHFSGNLDEEQKERLFLIADKCPIHKTLSHQVNITTMEM